jgi:hypothetical protein
MNSRERASSSIITYTYRPEARPGATTFKTGVGPTAPAQQAACRFDGEPACRAVAFLTEGRRGFSGPGGCESRRLCSQNACCHWPASDYAHDLLSPAIFLHYHGEIRNESTRAMPFVQLFFLHFSHYGQLDTGTSD